jgi:hypothetical protein
MGRTGRMENRMPLITTLNFWLWVAAGALCLAYSAAGIMKTTRPIPALAAAIRWPGDVPAPFVRTIGMLDLLGGLGVVLPIATGIATWLTPLAAACLCVLQLLAIGFHASRGETRQTLPINLVLLALSALVLWGRFPLFGF